MSSGAGAKLNALTLSGEINACNEDVDHPGVTAFIERRAKPRIRQPFPTSVEGTDVNGQAFRLSTQLENMSSRGLYLRMPRQVSVGDDLRFLISFSNGSKTGATASVLGRVLRMEPGADGLNGFGLAITSYEFV